MRVLLVEDNELNSEIAVALLESLGAAAETAANGQEALDALDASEPGHFDVVLMDIQMPVMNGLEATHRIRESARDDLRALPIVVLSANAFTEDVQESKRAGADDHLSKPISIKNGGHAGRNPRTRLILAALASPPPLLPWRSLRPRVITRLRRSAESKDRAALPCVKIACTQQP